MAIPKSKNIPASLGGWISITLGLFALFIVGSTVYGIYTGYHPLLLHEHWEALDVYAAYLRGNPELRLFWEQVREHRILFPKLLIFLDCLLVQGTGRLLLCTILLFQGMHAALLCMSLWKNDTWGRTGKIFFSLVALIFSFWFIQRENFLWSFQVCFILNGLSASLSAYLVCRIDGKWAGFPAWMTMVFAALSCGVATYSLASGLFMWGILLAIMGKTGYTRAQMTFWFLFGALLAVSYLIGYQSPPGHSFLREAFHLRMVVFLLAYLGNPVSGFSPLAGCMVGALGLFLFFFFTWRFWLEKEPTFYQKFSMAGTAYAVCTATITAVGRNYLGLESAASNRYYTPVLLFWFFLSTLVYLHLQIGENASRRIRIGALIFFALTIFPVQLATLGERAGEAYLKRDHAALSLIAGVWDAPLFSYLLPEDSLVQNRIPFLRDHRLSIYHEALPVAMGKNMPKEFQVDSGSGGQWEVGEIQTVGAPPREGLFIQGKIDRERGLEIPELILFTRGGVVVGLAKTRKRSCRGCFSGYVKGTDPGIELFGRVENKPRMRKFSLQQDLISF